MQHSTTDNACWHESSKGDLNADLLRVFRCVLKESQYQCDADEYHASLYCGTEQAAAIRETTSVANYQYGAAQLPYNICRNAVDTLVAKIAKHRPLPEVVTMRGDWAKQKKARKLSQLIDGQFYKCKFFERHDKKIVRDACILGRGVLKVYDQDGEVHMERVYPWELHTDRWDARHGEARNLYHCRTMDRGVVERLFPKLRGAIVGKFIRDDDGLEAAESTVRRIDVLEAWHLPSGPEAKDGRHVIIVEGLTLLDEKWEEDHFPFAWLHYSDPFTGDKGQGLVEHLEGYQYDLNLMASYVSDSYRMLGGTIVLVPDNAKITDQQFRSGVGTLLYHGPGGKPDVFQPTPIHPSTYNRQRDLRDDALADSGISQMSAMGQKPAGITAAVALETLSDIETERFFIFGRSHETFALDVARLVLSCTKRIAKEHGDVAIDVLVGTTSRSLVRVKWSEAELDDFTLRVFSTSLLPQQPAARLQRIREMWEDGIIDRSGYLRLLDAKDLQAELDLETADKMLIDEQIEYLLDSEEGDERAQQLLAPPTVDLEWAIKRAQQKLNRAQLDGAPEYVMELLREYMRQAKDLLPLPPEPAPAPPPPDAMAAPPMPPMDVPQPPGAPMMPPPPAMPPGGPIQ